MKINELLLYFIAKKYKSEWDNGNPQLKNKAGTLENEFEYAMFQFKSKVINGINIDVYQKRVVEIGCGHGGICVFASMNGAKEVIGTDLSDEALNIANEFKKLVELQTNRNLNLNYKKMTAESLEFEVDEIDLIIADNVLEHVEDLDLVLKECNRVLRKGGHVVVPNFPSILSKFGPHIKYGIKIPWIHIFFSEKTIINVMKEMAKTDKLMATFYPGLSDNSTTFKDIRAYKDLNYLTNKKFLTCAKRNGFSIDNYYVNRPKFGWILIKILPFLERTKLDDILSYGTTATLRKL
jgi:ubiquinone/menaquinone biosynthesis C-methylase UbiE